ncbi:mycofactocin precursor MftA [Streptomyces sp. YIM S03343]
MPEDRPTAESETAVVPADLDDMSEEILVEEVSIDGMCGVY